MEEDIAEERLHFWADRSGQSLTSHDAMDGIPLLSVLKTSQYPYWYFGLLIIVSAFEICFSSSSCIENQIKLILDML